MPTAGKAVAAMLFAGLMFAVTQMTVPLLPAFQPGSAGLVASALGALTGWRIAGVRSEGVPQAAARGITAALVASLWALLLGALWVMLRRSLTGIYDDPVEAITAAISLAVGYAQAAAHPGPLAVLLVGGALCGVAAGAVARRMS